MLEKCMHIIMYWFSQKSTRVNICTLCSKKYLNHISDTTQREDMNITFTHARFGHDLCRHILTKMPQHFSSHNGLATAVSKIQLQILFERPKHYSRASYSAYITIRFVRNYIPKTTYINVQGMIKVICTHFSSKLKIRYYCMKSKFKNVHWQALSLCISFIIKYCWLQWPMRELYHGYTWIWCQL